MKKILLAVLMFFIGSTTVNAVVMQGGVYENSVQKNYCTVIDKITKQPVANAKINIPSKKYVVYSDVNGHFEIKTAINTRTIMAVEKQNYKPFSLTLNRGDNIRPLVIEIEKSSTFDLNLENQLCHLGDNNFSALSANAGDFKTNSAGPVYSKRFYISNSSLNKEHYLVFGSIIGIDTALARGMGQNNITTSFASPPIVYFNGKKIAQIQINGDNQKIRLPKELIKWNQQNEITIKAGVNLMQTAFVDYDDFEFMNLSIETSSDNRLSKSNNINRY